MKFHDLAVVFSGASTKIPAHVGAWQAIEEHGWKINTLYGTSSGAIIAALIACGYDGRAMKDLVLHTDFSRFLKQTWFEWLKNLLWRRPGLVTGTYLARFLQELFGAKTFADLDTDLNIVGHSLNRCNYGVFCKETAPQTKIWEAVALSAAIPVLFQPCGQRKISPSRKALSYEHFVDGGVSKNFPVDLIKSPNYIGHLIESPSIYNWDRVTWRQMFDVVLNQLTRANVENSIANAIPGGLIVRTVYRKSTIDFRLSIQEKQALIDLGYINMNTSILQWLGKDQ